MRDGGRGPPPTSVQHACPPRSSIYLAGASGVPRGLRPQPARPACSPLPPSPDPGSSGLDIMGDGGEGEDEVQFLRTVSISGRGVSGATSLSVSLSMISLPCLLWSLRGDVSSFVTLGDCHFVSVTFCLLHLCHCRELAELGTYRMGRGVFGRLLC